jgi:hypothetical protein
LKSLSKTDLEILSELDKKIEYYTGIIEDLKDEKRYFYKKNEVDR